MMFKADCLGHSRFVVNKSDKNSAVINNRCLAFVQTRGLILLVKDYHVEDSFREILMYVYFG